MSSFDLLAALPFILIAGFSILVLAAVAFLRSHAVAFGLTATGLAASAASLFRVRGFLPYTVTSLLSLDGFTLFAIGLIIAAAFFIVLSSYGYLGKREDEQGEFYFLLLLATLGACVLAASSSFSTLFLGLELLSVSLFGLISYQRERGVGMDAAIKYLILSGVSSGFLLFGMALVYADTGTMQFSFIAAGRLAASFLTPAGIGLMIVGIGFKLAVVPFHLWTPDVYDGAPAPVSACIATVSKGAAAALLVRLFAPSAAGMSSASSWVFMAIAGLSMFFGNIMALREDNVKRILAYSSIAHLGYLLVGFLGKDHEAASSVAFYLAAYFAMTLGAFGVVTALSTGERDADSMEDYRASWSLRPWLTGVFAVMLLSLAGLPLTAGFVGKFLILKAGAGGEQWVLAVILAINSTISIFYYLRIVSVMLRPVATAPEDRPAEPPVLTRAALAGLTAVVLALGIYPAPLIELIQSLTAR